MWPGLGLETARVPPSLDSPQSAAPETFLSRDAASAFPLRFGPLPQSLPDVRCPVWDARELLFWRFFVSPALPRTDRAGRRVLFHLPCSQCRKPFLPFRGPCACPAGRVSGKKNRARLDPAACSILPGPLARHRQEEDFAPRKPRR